MPQEQDGRRRRSGACRTAAGRLGAAIVLFAAVCPPVAAEDAQPFRNPFIPDCSGLSGEADLCRLTVPFSKTQAVVRLGTQDFAHWIDGTTLNVAARAPGVSLRLTSGIQDGMTPLATGGEDGDRIWGAAFRLPHIDRSFLSLSLLPAPEGVSRQVYWGPNAPARLQLNEERKGTVETVALESRFLEKPRKITVYRPQAASEGGSLPVIYAVDGQWLESFFDSLDTLIERGEIEPVVFVGIWASTERTDKSRGGVRALEYIKGFDDETYARHENFVLRDVVPHVEDAYPVSRAPGDRLLFGYSNRGAWALAMGTDHPEQFPKVAAFSIASRGEDYSRAEGLSLYLAAGKYEPPFLRQTQRACDEAVRNGAQCDIEVYYAGHDSLMWTHRLADVVREVFSGTSK